MRLRFESTIDAVENRPGLRAIRSGLAMIVPALLIGSFCLVFQYFPLAGYQTFVNNLWNGAFLRFLKLIYNATFGMLSVHLCIAVSYCYARQVEHTGGKLCATLTSAICLFLCSGVIDTGWDALGVKGMFLAIFCGVYGSKLYIWLLSRTARRRPYMESSDMDFNAAMLMLVPATLTCVVFAVCSIVLMKVCSVQSMYELFAKLTRLLFEKLGRGVFSALLFVVVSSVLWFFGIHGSNVLESVMNDLFVPALDVNIQLLEAGKAPVEMFTKPFFDVFVLMGGCGTAICLLLAILLFSKRDANRRLSRMAVVPMLFNINEIMTFGFPVILNPTMLIPFLCTPVVTFLTSCAAMSTGLVPLVTSGVNWTTPVILGGYQATGSIRGSLLQIVNIVIGVAIYRPFVLAYDRQREAQMYQIQKALVDTMKESERTRVPVRLSELPGQQGSMARALQLDIRYFLEAGEMPLEYQPQFDAAYHCFGAEALLRWRHPTFGVLYPPLIIQLAKEDGVITELEKKITIQAMRDTAYLKKKTGRYWKISINVPAETLRDESFLAYLEKLMSEGEAAPGEICFEITEQSVLVEDEKTREALQRVRDMGYLLAIDDFSMGHTSLSYLQTNSFDFVKLDGALVRSLEDNPRCADIIRTLVSLAGNLDFRLIAEHVETRRQKELLEELGCVLYQGFLVSPSVPLLDLEQMSEETRSEKPSREEEIPNGEHVSDT